MKSAKRPKALQKTKDELPGKLPHRGLEINEAKAEEHTVTTIGKTVNYSVAY